MLNDIYTPAYTMFYETFCEDYDTFRSKFVEYMKSKGSALNLNVLGDSTQCANLDDIIYAKFYMWEVFTKDAEVFQQAMYSVFDKWCRYYDEMLNAYLTQINAMDGDKRTLEYTPRAEYENKLYDLPRSEASIDRPTTRSRNGGVEGKDTTEETKVNAVEQKAKWLMLIRNLWDEFAEKFKSCFIELFDYNVKEGYGYGR